MKNERIIIEDGKDDALGRLMADAQKGNRASYNRLLRATARVLEPYLRRRVSAGGWEDVLQDVLVSLHKVRHTYQPGRPYLPWMFAIARCRVADYWRNVSRFERFEPAESGPDAAAPTGPGDEAAAAVRSALEALSGRQKAVVKMLKLQGFTVRDTARELNMSEAAVKVTAHRAYKALAKILSNDFYENGHS